MYYGVMDVVVIDDCGDEDGVGVIFDSGIDYFFYWYWCVKVVIFYFVFFDVIVFDVEDFV